MPKIIDKTDDDNFVTASFASLLGELKTRGSSYFTLKRDDGGALGLLTTNPELIQYVEAAIEAYEDARAESEEASHAGN
jgi:hypothetical protein